MQYSPKPGDRRAYRLMWMLFAAGIVCVCVAAFLSAGRAILQFGTVAFLSAGVYVSVRYVFTEFLYVITWKNDCCDTAVQYAAEGILPDVRLLPPQQLDLVIKKTQGRRGTVTDARLALDELVYFAPLPAEGGRNREPYTLFPEMRVYSYTASFHPAQQYMAVFADSAGNTSGLILELTDSAGNDFRDLLAACVRQQ